MRARTHYVFSIGASLYGLSSIGELSPAYGLMVVWLSFTVNLLIDGAGHSSGPGDRPTRTRLTHSVFTAPAWGGLVGAASAYPLLAFDPSRAEWSNLALWVAAGALIALSHLFLDSLTQAGVYYWKHRIAVAHLSYNNFLLNTGFVALGVLLALAALVPARLVLPTQ